MRNLLIRDISQIFSCEFQNFDVELSVLEKIKRHDEYTYLHSLNVARISVSLGQRLQLLDHHLVDLGWAALLHDIGKLEVPLGVLNKLKQFSKDELTIMQGHPLRALQVFAETHPVTLDRLRRLNAAFEHHQRYDLRGYPRVGRKSSLHPFSRIVAVADTYDAMTTDRIYQRRMLPDIALKIMAQGFGTVFDPVVLQTFITTMGAYPVGSLVRLTDDQLGIVIAYSQGSSMDRPVLYLLGKDAEERIDLMNTIHKDLRILRSEFPEDHAIDVFDILERTRSLREDRDGA